MSELGQVISLVTFP